MHCHRRRGDCLISTGKDHLEKVRYLLEEAGGPITARAVMAAAEDRYLPFFEVFLKHEYLPNQQAPSSGSYSGTTLRHCLNDGTITSLLPLSLPREDFPLLPVMGLAERVE